MTVILENRGGIRRDETGAQFNARAVRVVTEAKALSTELCGSYIELNRWMRFAKSTKMTWMEGLCFSIERMRESYPGVGKTSPKLN
jgi:hypothetical protein